MVITGVFSKMGCSVFLVKGVGVKQGLWPNTVSIAPIFGFYLKSSMCRESPDMSLQFRNIFFDISFSCSYFKTACAWRFKYTNSAKMLQAGFVN